MSIESLEDSLINIDNNILFNIEEIPTWYKDNEYITNNYRRWGLGWCHYFKSIFQIHNETLNIWTHLLGAFLFIFLLFYTNISGLVKEPLGDVISINIFLLSAILCFSFSTIMHIFHPISDHHCKKLLKMDYIGISLLILGSYGPFIYYAFYCQQTIQIIYYVLLNIFGLCAIITTSYERFQKPSYRCQRSSIFVCLVASVIVPIIHRIILNPLKQDDFVIEMEYYILSLFFYLLGLVFFVSRVPERFFTNCNCCFLSHQIFHVLIIIGALITYEGIIQTHIVAMNITCNTTKAGFKIF